MKIPILALIPSAYRTSNVYSVLPVNGDGDFTFSRDSNGTRVQENGLIENVDNNVPRLDWLNSNCPSLLLEPQRTNNLKYSEDLTNSVWSLLSAGTGVNPIVTANYSIAPNGTLTADRVVLNQGSGTSNNDYSIIRQVVSSVGQGVSSVYMKSNTNNDYVISIDDLGTGIKNVTVTNQWQRFEYSETTNDRLQLSLRGNTNSNYADISVWGTQMEAGSYPTSYKKTEASTVTRLKDFISGGGNANLFNSLEGTFFVQMASFLNAQTNSNGIELSDSSGQNRVTIQYDTQNNQVRAEIKLANVTQALLFTNSYDVTNFNKIAVTYKYNEAKLYINGGLISTDTSVNIFAENTLTEVRSTIAGISADAFNLQAKIKDLKVYDRVLTEAEAIELTTL
jgi:hypothetical protein